MANIHRDGKTTPTPYMVKDFMVLGRKPKPESVAAEADKFSDFEG